MRKRILVVEDDFAYETILRRVLHEIDPEMTIEATSSAEVALASLRSVALNHEAPFDLIVADIFLDGPTTGLELWQNCQDACPDTPMIITSGLPVDKFFDTIGRNTISPPFLPKPFYLGECRQLIEAMFRHGQQQNAA